MEEWPQPPGGQAERNGKSLAGNTDLPPSTQHLRVTVSLSVEQGIIAVFKLDCCEDQMSQFREIT